MTEIGSLGELIHNIFMEVVFFSLSYFFSSLNPLTMLLSTAPLFQLKILYNHRLQSRLIAREMSVLDNYWNCFRWMDSDPSLTDF